MPQLEETYVTDDSGVRLPVSRSRSPKAAKASHLKAPKADSAEAREIHLANIKNPNSPHYDPNYVPKRDDNGVLLPVDLVRAKFVVAPIRNPNDMPKDINGRLLDRDAIPSSDLRDLKVADGEKVRLHPLDDSRQDGMLATLVGHGVDVSAIKSPHAIDASFLDARSSAPTVKGKEPRKLTKAEREAEAELVEGRRPEVDRADLVKEAKPKKPSKAEKSAARKAAKKSPK